MNYKKIQREFTDYAEMLKYVIKEEQKESSLNINDYFNIINKVFSLFKVNKAEYFTNPENIPDLKIKGKVYDLGCGVGFWGAKNKSDENNITGLDINETWLDIAKEITPTIEFKKFNVLEDDLDGDFTLIGNPPFDKYFMKNIFNLIEKAKESYLVIPEGWVKELSKTYKVDLVEDFVNPKNEKQMKSKTIFTSKMRANAGFLFHIRKDNIDTEKHYKDNVFEKYFKKEDEAPLKNPGEIYSEMNDLQASIADKMQKIHQTSREHHLSFWGDEYIAQNRFYYYEHLPLGVYKEDINTIVRKFPIEQIRQWDKEWCDMCESNMQSYLKLSKK